MDFAFILLNIFTSHISISIVSLHIHSYINMVYNYVVHITATDVWSHIVRQIHISLFSFNVSKNKKEFLICLPKKYVPTMEALNLP